MPLAGAPRCLIRLGLVTPPPDDPDVLVPVAPTVALAELLQPIRQILDSHQERVQEISSGFSAVQAMYRAARRESQDWLTLIDGEKVVQAALQQAVRDCRSELMTIQPSGERHAYDLADPDLVAEGVVHRTLYPHAARTNPTLWRHVQTIERAGAQVRTLHQVPDRMVVCDRTTGYLAYRGGSGHHGAVEIRHPAVVSFLACVFEDAWERATPVSAPTARARERGIVDEVQRAVMRLLVSGLTDDAIARRLGVSRRTVAGHVAVISRSLGSKSRAQLGYLIARTGAVSAEEPDAAA
ncbi:LuxR C-terminal-related transcriptional regulator [Streptomyces sp. NPDC049837]|uniref:LuxR C-terminal-related transcriptional regulator n=1 Tax=Streptomyces sp. NPDC049837 TaxID=3155277 RepID=UPI003419E588